ncbi:procollagen-lysine 5-dioxygenase [Aureococcus anophagefferens]|uniref:Procollagen-lysine 5-dioxygenase n=1 Tax=Aureococcus anophagefferens TaxID=44056 RepID=A0ABR1G7F3_AURAN
MNNYGVIVNDVGLEPFVKALQDKVCGPLAQALFKAHPHGHPAADFDSTHSFIVKYRGDEDPHLDVHTDDSDVTFNACLGRDFEGCGLVFCGMIGAKDHRQHCKTYEHRVGTCVCHLGSKRHGADDITRGERLNLIVWNHGLAFASPGAGAAAPEELREGGGRAGPALRVLHARPRLRQVQALPGGQGGLPAARLVPAQRDRVPGFEPDSI